MKSVNDVEIRFNDERWHHIIKRHPEMLTYRDLIEETIINPDFIQEGDVNEYIALKKISFQNEMPLFIVVVYRELNELDGFVLTSYLTRKPSERRKILWKK